MNVLVIGSNGQLGSDLLEESRRRGWPVTGLTHEDIVVEDDASVRRALERYKPDVVLNTAAFHVVPTCEQDPLRAFQVNALGALNIEGVCQGGGAGCLLQHGLRV